MTFCVICDSLKDLLFYLSLYSMNNGNVSSVSAVCKTCRPILGKEVFTSKEGYIMSRYMLIYPKIHINGTNNYFNVPMT